MSEPEPRRLGGAAEVAARRALTYAYAALALGVLALVLAIWALIEA